MKMMYTKTETEERNKNNAYKNMRKTRQKKTFGHKQNKCKWSWWNRVEKGLEQKQNKKLLDGNFPPKLFKRLKTHRFWQRKVWKVLLSYLFFKLLCSKLRNPILGGNSINLQIVYIIHSEGLHVIKSKYKCLSQSK
jgi:hypothetical protein